MKPQVMTIPTTIINEEQKNGEIPTKSGKLDILQVKQEPIDISEYESKDQPDAPGPRHSQHHLKKMMEKWMNVSEGDDRRHLSPSNHDNEENKRKSVSPSTMLPSKSPSRSPSTSLTSPPLRLSHIPADPRKWTAKQVEHWIDAVSAKYALVVSKKDFEMNGRALCLMKREGFLRRVPEKGALLFEDFRRRLRQYLTACLQRVRTTVTAPGMSVPGMVPHVPTPTASGASQVPTSTSPWCAPFSALRGVIGHDRTSTGVPGVPNTPHAGPLSFLHSAPFGGAPSFHRSMSLPQGIRQLPSRNIPLPPQVGASAGSSGQSLTYSDDVNGHPSPSGQPRASPSQHSLPQSVLPSSPSNGLKQFQLHSVPSSLHTSPSTLHTTMSTTSHAGPTPSASVAASCALHGSSSASHLHTSPFPYSNKCYLHPSPYYQFVPIYRTMKVVGHFQPIPYGYPMSTPAPATLPTARADYSNQSYDRVASPIVTSRPNNQSHALDLSTSNSRSTTPMSSGGRAVSPANERKRIKTEPL